MGMAPDSQKRLHAIMIPLPLQGHINPFVHLATKLASKGFTITFVLTHFSHHRLFESQPTHGTSSNITTAADFSIFAEARKSGMDIRQATISDGLPLEFDRSLNLDMFVESINQIFPTHIDEFIGNMLRSEPQSTFFLIGDTYYVWPSLIAEKYNLINVSFWTEPALVFTLYYHLDLLKENGHFGSKNNRKDKMDYIPGVGEIKPTDLTSYLQDTNTSTVLHRTIFKSFEEVKKADFIICNAVQELESETISALHQNQPFYAIGPIFLSGPPKRAVGTNLWAESDCTQWLNTKPHGSVLYVTFGSLATCSPHDIMEIAHGLWNTDVNFMWALRPDIAGSGVTNILPVGFEDRVKDRGIVVPWCHQMDVISHSAIGGFLTHCGWNSILESIWCGVPLLCFPLDTDQFTNRKLTVDDWRIGINLCDEKSITRKEVSEKIKIFMSEKGAKELRIMMKIMRNTLVNAWATNGSSERNLDLFIKHLKAHIQRKCGPTIL